MFDRNSITRESIYSQLFKLKLWQYLNKTKQLDRSVTQSQCQRQSQYELLDKNAFCPVYWLNYYYLGQQGIILLREMTVVGLRQ